MLNFTLIQALLGLEFLYFLFVAALEQQPHLNRSRSKRGVKKKVASATISDFTVFKFVVQGFHVMITPFCRKAMIFFIYLPGAYPTTFKDGTKTQHFNVILQLSAIVIQYSLKKIFFLSFISQKVPSWQFISKNVLLKLLSTNMIFDIILCISKQRC